MTISYDKSSSRITLEMSGLDMVMAVCEGNPGAVTAVAETMKHGAAIDPDSAFGEYSAILALDMHGIYGSRVWLLYKDVCKLDVGKMIGLLRAVQLGLATESQLSQLIDGRASNGEPDMWLAKVREQLPDFNPTARAQVAA